METGNLWGTELKGTPWEPPSSPTEYSVLGTVQVLVHTTPCVHTYLCTYMYIRTYMRIYEVPRYYPLATYLLNRKLSEASPASLLLLSFRPPASRAVFSPTRPEIPANEPLPGQRLFCRYSRLESSLFQLLLVTCQEFSLPTHLRPATS